jgi:hypothetical protein
MSAAHRERENNQNIHTGDNKCQWIIMTENLLLPVLLNGRHY